MKDYEVNKMGMFSKLNVRSTVRDGIDTKNMEFKPLKDFCGKTIKADGFFFTHGRYGDQVVLVGAGYLINMPGRAFEQFATIAQDEAMVKAVLEGHLRVTDIKMIETKNGTTAAYKLEDC